MFNLSWRAALIFEVMSDGRTRTEAEIYEEVEAMSGDQQVQAIQDWMPLLSTYRTEDE